MGEAPELKVTWEPLAEDPLTTPEELPMHQTGIGLSRVQRRLRGHRWPENTLEEAGQRSGEQTGPGWPEELQLPSSPAKILLWEELWETGKTFKP